MTRTTLLAVLGLALLSGCASRGGSSDDSGSSALAWALMGYSAYGNGYANAYRYTAPAPAAPAYCGGQWFGSIWHSYCY